MTNLGVHEAGDNSWLGRKRAEELYRASETATGGDVSRDGGSRGTSGWLVGRVPWMWWLKRVRRMDPAPVYYLVVGGAGTLAGVAADVLGLLPWWAGTIGGLVGAWIFTWLTALDDVRHPVHSIRMLWGELRDPPGAWLRRARLLEAVLWAPPARWGGEVIGRSTGKQSEGGLFTVPRYRFGITWAGAGRQLTIRVEGDDDGRRRDAHLAPDICGEAGLLLGEPLPDHADLAEQLESTIVTVDGVERPGQLLELGVEEADWILQVDDVDGHRLVVTGNGLPPGDVELVRLTVDELLERWPTLARP